MKNQLIRVLCIAMLLVGVFFEGCKKESTMDESAGLGNESTAKLSSKLAAVNQNPMMVRKPISYYDTFTETDFVSAGVGGLWNAGFGTIELPNSFSNQSIKKALLYWHGLSNSQR